MCPHAAKINLGLENIYVFFKSYLTNDLAALCKRPHSGDEVSVKTNNKLYVVFIESER